MLKIKTECHTAWDQKMIHMERISHPDTNCAQAQNHIQLRIGLVKIHRHVLSPRMVFLIANSNQLEGTTLNSMGDCHAYGV